MHAWLVKIAGKRRLLDCGPCVAQLVRDGGKADLVELEDGDEVEECCR